MQPPELIEAAKKNNNMKDADLARELGVAYQDLSNWKHGRRTCPPDMRARMAALCGMDPGEALVIGYAEGLSEQRKEGLRQALRNAGDRVLKFLVKQQQCLA
jgi:transcriptional regulator with XRE-family HTH domain